MLFRSLRPFYNEFTDKPQSFQRRETLRYRLFLLFVRKYSEWPAIEHLRDVYVFQVQPGPPRDTLLVH
jgi:hypothetical protein